MIFWESVRIFYIKGKVNLLTITGANIPQRQETNASKACIRYIAGYCLSSLGKKFMKMQSANIYSKTVEGQASYDYAKCALKVITAVREDEHFSKTNTCDPDSLADIERRQYSSGRLINVSDFFSKSCKKLTSSILSILIYDNLMKHGKDLMSYCLRKIMEKQECYLSNDVASGSEITPCSKIDKPLVVYIFTGNVMTSITTLCI